MAFAFTRSETCTVALIFWLGALHPSTPTLRRVKHPRSSKYCLVTTSTAGHNLDKCWIYWFGEVTTIEWCALRATTKPTFPISCRSQQYLASGDISEVSRHWCLTA